MTKFDFPFVRAVPLADAASVAQRWKRQMANTPGNAALTAQLLALPPDAPLDDVDRIIGNKSWTRTMCTRCRTDSREVVEVGEPPDYESATVILCRECAAKTARDLGAV